MFIFIISGCKSSNDAQKHEEELPKRIEIVFQTTPEVLYVNEPTTFQLVVTDGEEPIEHAGDVQFEIRRKGEEHDEMIIAHHKGNGVYVAEKTFATDGVYVVTYHVTVNNLHRMEKNEVRVEQKQEATTQAPKQSNHTHTHEHDHVHITFSPQEAKQNERTMFQVQIVYDDKPLTEAQVTMEYWKGENTKHTYVPMNEQGNGTYVAEASFTSLGTYQFRVHVIKEDIHDHKVFSVEIE
ncbi:FixH family protein [Anoxybacillus kestanbolensis]|nr:FixH family protein [Anoxybacillus kestanbolensis]